MTIMCERKECANLINGVCNQKNVRIRKDGYCHNFAEFKEFYREDNVVVMDKNGLPSIMVKFTRKPDAKPIHPMFLIGGEVYDEIFISKYKNCIINGLAYSLPMQKPATHVTLEEAEKTCFDKGEGWHLMTAMEHGFLANYSLENGTLPHGNKKLRKVSWQSEEKCETYDGARMLTGTGPDTWTHDHTAFGVEGLCGDIYEWVRGMRLMDGKLEIANNNDAAMPIDLSEYSSLWLPVEVGKESVYLVAEDEKIRFTTEEPEGINYDGCDWKDVKFDFNLPEVMKNLGLFVGEPETCIYADMNGERLPLYGGCWYETRAGVFDVKLSYSRYIVSGNLGFRSAYYRKKK